MKKQLLSIAIVTMLLVATLISTVNAATISASAVKEGVTTVTMKMEKPVESATVTLKYDSTIFEVAKDKEGNPDVTIDGNTGLEVNAGTAGEVTVVVYGSKAVVNEIKVNFKVKAGATENAGDKEVAGTFEVTRFEDADETFAEPSVKLVVKKAGGTTPTPTPSKKPTTSTTPTPKPGNNGTLANTGAPLYVVGIAAIVVAAFVLMVKKAK